MVLNKHLINTIQLLGTADDVKLGAFNIDFQKIDLILTNQVIEQHCRHINDLRI